jgi:tetratricopeptide (TPR) repeat protein
MDDQPNLASSLTGRAHASCSTLTLLTLVPSVIPVSPRRDLKEALRIAQEIGSADVKAWVLWSEGLLNIVRGRYGQALEAAHDGLGIATQIGHREDMTASQCVLGVLCLALLAPEAARRHLEAALSLAEGLRSPAMIHWAIGALTAACCQLDDVKRAQACLETVLSAKMPMDTMYGRYYWARRAELALCQGEPALALDIVERLIASALNMVPGCVITFLWKLKGEALSAMGRREEAQALLQAAVENAQATGERFLLWRLHASLGRLYLAMDQQSEAGEAFASAHELIQELADTLPDGELRNSFLQRAHDRLSASP